MSIREIKTHRSHKHRQLQIILTVVSITDNKNQILLSSVKVNGEVRDVSRRVYQRNDIDINYYDEVTGLTNLERMQAGKPPIGSDGKPIQLHHILQKEAGPMVEIRETTHQEYYSQLHGLIEDGASFRNDPILNKQYNNFRRSYWKWRAEQIIGGQ